MNSIKYIEVDRRVRVVAVFGSVADRMTSTDGGNTGNAGAIPSASAPEPTWMYLRRSQKQLPHVHAYRPPQIN